MPLLKMSAQIRQQYRGTLQLMLCWHASAGAEVHKSIKC